MRRRGSRAAAAWTSASPGPFNAASGCNSARCSESPSNSAASDGGGAPIPARSTSTFFNESNMLLMFSRFKGNSRTGVSLAFYAFLRGNWIDHALIARL